MVSRRSEAPGGSPRPTCRPCQPAELPALVEAFAPFLHGDVPTVESYLWSHAIPDSPSAPPRLASLAAWEDGRPVAHCGAQLRPCRLRGEELLAVHVCDMGTLPSHRRRGLAEALLRAGRPHWLALGARLLFSIPSQGLASHDRPGLLPRRDATVHRLTLPLRPWAGALKRRVGGKAAALFEPLWALARPRPFAAPAGSGDLTVEEAPLPAPDSDLLWQRLADTRPFWLRRDGAFSSRRFGPGAGRPFRLLMARDPSGPRARLVYAPPREPHDSAWVGDLLCAPGDEAAEGALYERVLSLAWAAGASEIFDMASTGTARHRALRAMGFQVPAGGWRLCLDELSPEGRLDGLRDDELYLTAGDFDVL